MGQVRDERGFRNSLNKHRYLVALIRPAQPVGEVGVDGGGVVCLFGKPAPLLTEISFWLRWRDGAWVRACG